MVVEDVGHRAVVGDDVTVELLGAKNVREQAFVARVRNSSIALSGRHDGMCESLANGGFELWQISRIRVLIRDDRVETHAAGTPDRCEDGKMLGRGNGFEIDRIGVAGCPGRMLHKNGRRGRGLRHGSPVPGPSGGREKC